MTRLSRREFAVLAASAAVPLAFGRETSAATVTAQDVADRITKNLGVEWKPDSVDGFKAGAPATIATGIVTTSLATLNVLQQAVKAGANVIITAHATFYSRSDAKTPPPARGSNAASPVDDPVFTAKGEFIAKNKLAVFRLSDHWRLRRPDPFAQGMANALGWSTYQHGSDPSRYDVPPMTLDALASDVRQRLKSRGGIRVVGAPALRVQRVGLLPGTSPIQASLTLLPDVDLIIAGEVREWESVEYARDKSFVGERKALMVVGRVVSDEAGMGVCADWLKTLVPEVTVRHIPAGDPYWRPAP